MKRKTVKRKSTREKQAQAEKRKKSILIIFMCAVLICVGYIGADAFMIRHAEPVHNDYSQGDETGDKEAESDSNISSVVVSPLALDDSVMLSSVISETGNGRFNGITFDLKREDGTIGYESSLTAIDTFGAIALPSSKLYESVKRLNDKKITPIARICCYKDNLAPSKSSEMALMNGNKLYRDEKGNTYLNPDSEAAYKYIKDIVLECYNLGVRNFVLTSVKLPKAVSKGHSDGFDALTSKLKRDIASDIIFYSEVDVTLNGWNEEDGEYNETGFKNQIKKMPKLKAHQIYYIKTDRSAKTVKKALKKNAVKNYIISEN